MAQKQYYLIRRKDRLTDGKSTYYVRFRTEDGSLLPWRSTGETAKTRAENYAIKRLRGGRLIAKESLTFGSYAEGWWTPEHPYVQGRLARGRRLVPTYLVVMRGCLANHVLPYFKDTRLAAINLRQIEEWLLKIRKDGKLRSVSINHALRCLKIMLREAARNDIIPRDPSAFVTGLAQEVRERGILTVPEMRALSH
jgi:hypothetical protein